MAYSYSYALLDLCYKYRDQDIFLSHYIAILQDILNLKNDMFQVFDGDDIDTKNEDECAYECQLNQCEDSFYCEHP